jgi:hypothetical protein
MHMHAMGVPRNVANVKLRKTYPVGLEPVEGRRPSLTEPEETKEPWLSAEP